MGLFAAYCLPICHLHHLQRLMLRLRSTPLNTAPQAASLALQSLLLEHSHLALTSPMINIVHSASIPDPRMIYCYSWFIGS